MVTKFIRNHRRIRQSNTWVRVLCFGIAVAITSLVAVTLISAKKELAAEKAVTSYLKEHCPPENLKYSSLDMSTSKLTCHYNHEYSFRPANQREYLAALHKKNFVKRKNGS